MTNRILDRRAVTLGLAGALCMPAVLRAQASYPDRPINLIVPFAAGGPTDAIARIYAEFISRDLGQTLVIENVAGAGGTIGSIRAARSTPDGYIIQIGQAGTHVSSVGLYKNLQRASRPARRPAAGADRQARPTS